MIGDSIKQKQPGKEIKIILSYDKEQGNIKGCEFVM